jgi:hypothetical protein
MTTENNATRPTHRIYAVTKNGKGTIWKSIGVLWPHQDGKGFQPRLECLPLNAAIVIREISNSAEDDNGGAP